jgi:hypothetical protein
MLVDVEVARPNIMCIFEDMCCLLSNSCFIGNTIANVLTLNVEVQATPPSVRQMEQERPMGLSVLRWQFPPHLPLKHLPLD